MAKRYELSKKQWEKIKKPRTQHKKGDRGRPDIDNLNFVNGVLWVLRSDARWSDLPERYGKYRSVIIMN